MGKPGGADLQLGLATGPALFAWEEHPELGPLIERKFKEPGDVELVRQLCTILCHVSSDHQLISEPPGPGLRSTFLWFRANESAGTRTRRQGQRGLVTLAR